LGILQGQLTKAGITPRCQREADLPRVRLDAHQIQQVLINLLLNAIQAMPEAGDLTIRTFREAGGGVGVAIQDTGIGIPQAHLKRVFDPFFTTKSEGTGLGLSISLKILDSHRATLQVASREGEGSVFTIHFPAGEPLALQNPDH
jgi:signal transduction histidine kinase